MKKDNQNCEYMAFSFLFYLKAATSCLSSSSLERTLGSQDEFECMI